MPPECLSFLSFLGSLQSRFFPTVPLAGALHLKLFNGDSLCLFCLLYSEAFSFLLRRDTLISFFFLSSRFPFVRKPVVSFRFVVFLFFGEALPGEAVVRTYAE